MIETIGPGSGAGPLPAALCAPVGWLFRADDERHATCFLVHDCWIATAGHVFASEEDAADFIAVFNHLEGVDPSARDAYALCPETGFVTRSEGADFAFARVCPRPGKPAPGELWGKVDIAAPAAATERASVVNVQHRVGMSAKSFSTGQIAQVDGDWILHDAAATEGASGAPLFDAQGAWIGIHKGRHNALWRATSAAAIVAALQSIPDLPDELRQAIEAATP